MEKLKDKIVLLVDDEERNLFALQSYLETLQMQVSTAMNGEETIAMLKTGFKPNIILLDMMMPVMDGYETLGYLKNSTEFNEIPVIALTAKVMKGDREKCLDAGAWDYVSKPVNTKALIETMNKWIT